MSEPIPLGPTIGARAAPGHHARRDGADAPSHILIVDDEESIRTALSRYLAAHGYLVATADSGEAALAQLAQARYALAVCDIRMPGISGLELVSRATSADPDLAVVMLTALNDAGTATEALGRGALDYLVKPVDLDELAVAIGRALHKRALRMQHRRVEELVREEVATRTEELRRERQALRDLTVQVAETLIHAMEARDPYMGGRSYRIGELAASMASELDLGEENVEALRIAGRLHDVGMIGLRESVLTKPGPLTAEEMAHVRTHVAIGMRILAPLRHLGVVLDYVHDHHERWDGTGYPRGLAGETISIGGRILAGADAFDALTSRRAYRAAISSHEALERLRDGVGTQLDPNVYDTLRLVVLRRKSLIFIE